MIYLDNAATSYPKPPVLAAQAAALLEQELGNPFRSGHQAARHSAATIWRVKSKLATLINAQSPEHIALCYNCSDAMNMLLMALVRQLKPQHLLTSVLEHNSLLRPLAWLAEQHAITLDICQPSGSDWQIDWSAVLSQRLKDSHMPILLTMAHVANTTGTMQDLKACIAQFPQSQIYRIIDGAQSVGHFPIDVQAQAADAWVFPAHKGLLGPTGLGFIWLGDRLRQLPCYGSRFGGSGQDSTSRFGPEVFPHWAEIGTPNLHGMVLFEPVLDWLLAPARLAQLHQHIAWLQQQLYQQLAMLPTCILYGPLHLGSGIVLLNLKGWDCETLAALLDSRFGIAVRAGLHCAPLAHQWLGTTSLYGGAVRVSFGPFNQIADVTALVNALSEMAGETAKLEPLGLCSLT
jgi:cysteine desulfurase/selenocysteine lyase